MRFIIPLNLEKGIFTLIQPFSPNGDLLLLLCKNLAKALSHHFLYSLTDLKVRAILSNGAKKHFFRL